MSELAQPLIAGKYRILRSLASGGMGALWLAEHVELETVVVVKRLLELRDSEADVARFRREAKEAAALRSRHIVRVHDFGTDEQGPYLVMELLRGQDLCSLIEQRGPLPVDLAASLFRQAAKALRVAHAAGVVHRDIKPSNLFLAEEEGETVLKVLDFGIAKRFAVREGSAAITASGLLLGSPGYMAPEQVRGQRVDTRADVWALGVVLYEMLTNAPPFYSEHVGDSLVRVCAGDYAPLTSLRRDLGGAWDDFFAHALAVDPDLRFQNVDIMLHALEQVLAGAPDLSRVLAGAPTLKATSGDVGSIAPAPPERESWSNSKRASALGLPMHNPRTLDASQVPISEPTQSGPSTRLLLWAAASVLLVLAAGLTWFLRPSKGEEAANPPATSASAATKASDALPGKPAAPPANGPTSADGAIDTLPTAEALATTPVQPPVTKAPPTSAASSKAGGAASTKTNPAKTPLAKTTSEGSASKAADAPPPKPSQPRSSQPKRDPFTGLVME